MRECTVRRALLMGAMVGSLMACGSDLGTGGTSPQKAGSPAGGPGGGPLGGADPNGMQSPVPDGEYPIPAGFQKVGDFSTAFVFWGRYTTNYASGGSGPSQRWDDSSLAKLNMVAGYEFKIGPDHGTRNNSDQVDFKLPRCDKAGGNRGDYEAFIAWNADGSNSTGGVGKEYPHPDTSHLPFNVDNPKPQIGNVKDGNWHGMLAAIYNDPQNVPTIEVWYNATASGRIEDYVFLGRSKDTGNISPGPVLPYSGDGGSGAHPLQVRIDEIPQAQLEVRKIFAVEVTPPSQ